MSTRRRFFDAVVRHRWAVLAAYGLLLAGAAVGLQRLRVDYSAEQFFLFQGGVREDFEAFKRHFPREDLQVSAFLEVEGPLTVEDFRRLEAIARSFEDVGLRSVRWLGGVELVEEEEGGEGEDAVAFIRLEDEEDLEETTLRALLATRGDHPLWTGVLWSPDQRVFAVHGFLMPDENTDARRREVTAALQARLDEIGAGGGRLVLNGLPVLRVTVPLALSSDLGRLLGLGVLLALVLVWAYFRRLRLALLTLAGVVPAVLLVLAGLGFVGRPLSVLTTSTPIVVLVVGLCDAIHLMVGTRYRWLRGAGTADAVVDAFTDLSRACFYTSLTTALGFVGLVGTRIPLVAEFGIVTALAVLATWVVSLTLLPALLALGGDLGPRETRLSRLCEGLAEAAAATLRLPPGRVLAAFGLAMAAGLLLASGLQVRAFLIDDLRDGDPILEELRWLEDAGFGVFQVNVFMEHDELPGHAPEVLAWTEGLTRFAAADTLVLGAISLPAAVREMGRAAGLDAGPGDAFDAGGAWSTATVRELLFLAELQGDPLTDDLYRIDEGASQVILPVRDLGSEATSRFLGALEARLAEDPVPGGRATVTGTVKLSQVMWDLLLDRFLPGVALSVVLVWLCLSWMFRSVRTGAVALLPNLFPLAVLAGVLRLGGFDLKPSTAIVFSMAFGIVADDTIHVLSHLAARGDGRSPRRVQALMREVGPALILSTAVVCAGFGILVLSRFEALFLIGLFTAVAAVLALLADLVALPHLFRAAGVLPRPQPSPPPSVP